MHSDKIKNTIKNVDIRNISVVELTKMIRAAEPVPYLRLSLMQALQVAYALKMVAETSWVYMLPDLKRMIDEKQ